MDESHTSIAAAPTVSLARARRRIKGASFAAFAAAAATAIGCLIIAWQHKSAGPLVFLVDPLLLAGLGYGVWRNSRVCALALLVYWIVSREAQLANIVVSYLWFCLVLAAAYLFLAGVIGTFSLHRQQRRRP